MWKGVLIMILLIGTVGALGFEDSIYGLDREVKTVTFNNNTGSVNTTVTDSWTRTGTDVHLTNIGDNVGIGTATPSTTLEVSGSLNVTGNAFFEDSVVITDTSNVNMLKINSIDGFAGMGFHPRGTQPAVFNAFKARGTFGTETQALKGDELFRIRTRPFDGSDWQIGSSIEFYSAEDVTAGGSGGYIVFGNSPIGDVLPVEVLRLEEDGTINVTKGDLIINGSGKVGIGTTSPSATLDVVGNGIIDYATNQPNKRGLTVITTGTDYNNPIASLSFESKLNYSGSEIISSRNQGIIGYIVANDVNSSSMANALSMISGDFVTQVRNKDRNGGTGNNLSITGVAGLNVIGVQAALHGAQSNTTINSSYGIRLKSVEFPSQFFPGAIMNVKNAYGLYLLNPVDSSGEAGVSINDNYGIYLEKQTQGASNNYGITLDGDGAGADIVFGDEQDASISFDGTNLVINPQEAGSGNVKIPAGDFQVYGQYNENLLRTDANTQTVGINTIPLSGMVLDVNATATSTLGSKRPGRFILTELDAHAGNIEAFTLIMDTINSGSFNKRQGIFSQWRIKQDAAAEHWYYYGINNNMNLQSALAGSSNMSEFKGIISSISTTSANTHDFIIGETSFGQQTESDLINVFIDTSLGSGLLNFTQALNGITVEATDLTNFVTKNFTGIKVDKFDDSKVLNKNIGIWLNGDGAGSDIVFGNGQDASISYDGTNLVINPQEVGSGNSEFVGKVNITDLGSTTMIGDLADLGLGFATIGLGTTDPLSLNNYTFTSDGTNLNINRPLDYSIIFREENVIQMVLDDNGQLGIGTSNPTHELNVVGDVNITGNITTNQYYGEMWFHNDSTNGQEFAVLGVNTWTNITGFNQVDDSGSSGNGLTYLSTSNGSLKTEVGGKYKIDYSVSFGSSGTNDEWQIAVAINDVIQDNTEAHRYIGSPNEVGNAGGSGFIDLVSDDIITMQIKNKDASTNAQVHSTNLNLVRIGD